MKNILKTGIISILVIVTLTNTTWGQTKVRKNASLSHAGTTRNRLQKNIEQFSRQHSGQAGNRANTVARTTSPLAERLIGVSDYNYNTLYGGSLGLTDSTKYLYSGSHSSTFDYNHMFFDPTFYFAGTYIMGFGSNVGFNNHNNQPAILFDTSWTWINGFSSAYGIDTFALGDVTYANYDTNFNATDWADLHLMDATLAYDDNRYINIYDASSNLQTSYTLSWYYGIWDTAQLRKFTYDINNNVIQDSTFLYMGGGTWQPFEKWDYTFDDSSNMTRANFYFYDAGAWQYQEQYTMRYDAQNRLRWDSVIQYIDSVWTPQASDTLGYTAGIDFSTYEQTLNISGGTPASILYRTKHVTSGRPDTLYQWEVNYSDNSIIDRNKFAFAYDTYNEPTTQWQYMYILDSPAYTTGHYDTVPDNITHFYYETYYPRHTADVLVVENAEHVLIYPNPATNEVNISRPQAAAGTKTSLEIINASGQVVKTEHLQWMNATETISVAELMPGVYWLIIQDNSSNIISKQFIIKQ